MRLTSLGLLAVFTWTSELSGQESAFDLARLSQGVDSMSIAVIRDTDTIPVGELWDEILALPVTDGRALLRRVYKTANRAFGPHLDTAYADLRTLQPIRRRTYSLIAADSLVWRADSITGWVTRQHDSVGIVARSLPPGTIDPGSFDLLVRSADLRIGVIISARSYIAATDSLVTLSAKVEGMESVTQRDGSKVLTWRLLGDFAGMRVDMWVSTTDRALARELIWLAPNIAMYMLR